MSIYTCIMQIEQRTKIWSLLLVTINKILCQFFEFTQKLETVSNPTFITHPTRINLFPTSLLMIF